LFPDLSSMAHVFRSQFNQHEAFIKPLVAWLEAKQVNFVKGAVVKDVGFAESSGRLTADRLDIQLGSGPTTIAVASDDIVLVTTGSQAADMSPGKMDEPPGPPPHPGQSWALWKKLAEKDKRFGNPDAFFGDPRIPDSRWVTFTVTTTGKEYLDEITNLTRSGTGSGGLLTLQDSSWIISLSIFEQPEVLSQPPGTSVWWGYGLYPERKGNYVQKPMYECTGREILTELLAHLRFDKTAAATMTNSICIPCNMPYVNNIWLPRKSGDRPPVVPEGVTNLGLLGQYVELERDIAFTFEYSTRTAWEAIHRLTKRGPPPPPVYQGQYDPKGVWAALTVFLGLTTT
jgi:oleate hydratase